MQDVKLLNGDCLELMKSIPDDSIDLIFCDLPYGQTSCKWDNKINLEEFWKQILRIKKLRTPIFMTTTTKFGVDLISSAPKKCPFRYDLVWVKSAPAGFLSAKKMPMRKHEMIYVFYEKLPLYDLSSHKHKFLRERKEEWCDKNGLYGEDKNVPKTEYKYDPPLPVSVVKQDKKVIKGVNNTYNTSGRKKPIVREKGDKYDPPLPVSVVKEPEPKSKMVIPNSETYGKVAREQSREVGGCQVRYDPPLPVSVVKESNTIYNNTNKTTTPLVKHGAVGQTTGQPRYDPPLPDSLLEIKSTKGKHSTEKPVALIEWLLKYYSKENDIILDPTMGSGSTGLACKNMNRRFIGIELDKDIFKNAFDRLKLHK